APGPRSSSRTSRQIQKALDGLVGSEAEAVDWRPEPVNPVDREAEGLGAERVPAVRRDEADLFWFYLKPSDCQLVDLRRRLVEVQLMHAEHGIELQSGVRHHRLDHVRRAACQDRLLA